MRTGHTVQRVIRWYRGGVPAGFPGLPTISVIAVTALQVGRGAQRASDSVKRYGVIALCVGLAIIVRYLILAAVVLSGSTTTTFGG